MSQFRLEQDSLGTKEVPSKAYYGIQTQRAIENFQITGKGMHEQLIRGLAYVKKAAIVSNNQAGLISDDVSEAVVKACDKILAGEYRDQFIVDAIQGGAGTSMNMNINEVLANLASEMLGHEIGKYDFVHPNDHCNFGQSTNDVVPTAGKIAVIRLSEQLREELQLLTKQLWDMAVKYRSVIKMGRTHLQDAVPISFGQQFGAYASALDRDLERIKAAEKGMKVINMGATAVGTGLNADKKYFSYITKELSSITGIDFIQAEDLVDATRNLDNFVAVSSSLKTLAVNLSKTANDLRLMASGPKAGLAEINLPQMQPGSSIMPGKVNPVIPEVVNQVAFQVMGNDLIITKAAEAGQLELNVFEPVLFKNLLESLEYLTNACRTFREKALVGLEVNKDVCIRYVERSAGIVTALAPHLGYAICSRIAKQAVKEDVSVVELILSEGLMSKEDLDFILDVDNMTSPGIAGEELLKK